MCSPPIVLNEYLFNPYEDLAEARKKAQSCPLNKDVFVLE